MGWRLSKEKLAFFHQLNDMKMFVEININMIWMALLVLAFILLMFLLFLTWKEIKEKPYFLSILISFVLLLAILQVYNFKLIPPVKEYEKSLRKSELDINFERSKLTKRNLFITLKLNLNIKDLYLILNKDKIFVKNTANDYYEPLTIYRGEKFLNQKELLKRTNSYNDNLKFKKSGNHYITLVFKNNFYYGENIQLTFGSDFNYNIINLYYPQNIQIKIKDKPREEN